jgi:outer membrane protein OmpA-like peptidoglycan-associated protein
MKKLLIPSLLAIITLLSACANHHYKKGNKYYDALAYSKAIPHYEKALSKKSINDAAVKLAQSYMRVNDIDNAEKRFAEAVYFENIDPINFFYYGKVLMAQGKCSEARKWFSGYLKYKPEDVVAKMLLASCNSIQERMRDTTLFKLSPANIDEFANVFSGIEYKDGVVFAADKDVFRNSKKASWTGHSYLDLYYIQKDKDGFWMDPQLLRGDINGPFHDGPATFSKDGNTVYFTRSNYFKRKMKKNERNENNLKIFKATLQGDKWRNLEELPFNSDDYSCGHPTLSEDGKTLYFVSDMPGGYGGTDIYKVTWDGSKWSSPENLGPVINTPGNEMFPYIHSDGSLYFSSDAHNSMGGLDVFITYYNGNRWMQPENLNYPLNTIRDDFAFTLNSDNKSGFVSSSRTNNDRLYTFTKNPPTFNLIGMARKKGTQIPVEGVTVQITNFDTDEKVVALSGKDGKFKIKLKPESEYMLLCTMKGCFSRTDNINTKGLKYSQDFYADFEVEEIVIDKPIVLENIYYDFDKWNIRPDAAVELDKLVKLLKDNPNIDIEMGSHTDSRGSDAYNMVLSDKRAKAAVDYLVFRGIDPKRLKWKGYGETMHVNKCSNNVHCSEEEHQKNRRTEFKVIKIHE